MTSSAPYPASASSTGASTSAASAGTSPCPCGQTATPGKAGGRPLAYAVCCGRWHAGTLHLQAPDAESLMRSRYTAFVLGLADYLLATWHPRTRPADLRLEGPELRWLGLTVKTHRRIDADHATVSFVARSKMGGRAQRLQETSRFVREHETAGPRWYYLDGDVD